MSRLLRAAETLAAQAREESCPALAKVKEEALTVPASREVKRDEAHVIIIDDEEDVPPQLDTDVIKPPRGSKEDFSSDGSGTDDEEYRPRQLKVR